MCSISRKYGQKMDREIQTTSVSFLSMPGWGEQTIPVLLTTVTNIGKETRQGMPTTKYPDFFHPAFPAQHMARHPPSPLLSRAHLGPPKLYTKQAGVQVHSKGCSKDSGTYPPFTPVHAWMTTTLRLLLFLVPKVEDCIKGSVLKREYLPMKNQHPHKTKSQRHKLVNKSEQVTRGIGKVPGGLKQRVSLAT